MARIIRFPGAALRTRVTLFSPVDLPDGMGGQQRSWLSMGQRWAQVVLNDAGGRRAPKNPRLQVILRSGASSLRLPLRLRWRGENYRVIQLLDVAGEGVLQLTCESGI